MPSKTPAALTTVGLIAVLLAGCSSPEPVTTGGRAVAAPTATAATPAAPAADSPAPAPEDQPSQPTVPASPEQTTEVDEADRPAFVAQTLKGTSSDGRKLTVRIDALVPESLGSYFEDTGAGADYFYVMATCDDRCSLADLGPMTLVGEDRTLTAEPVAGLGEQEGPIFDVAPAASGGGAVLPASGEEIDTKRADELWDRAFELADQHRLGTGGSRRIYVVEADQIAGTFSEAQVRIGRQSVRLTS